MTLFMMKGAAGALFCVLLPAISNAAIGSRDPLLQKIDGDRASRPAKLPPVERFLEKARGGLLRTSREMWLEFVAIGAEETAEVVQFLVKNAPPPNARSPVADQKRMVLLTIDGVPKAAADYLQTEKLTSERMLDARRVALCILEIVGKTAGDAALALKIAGASETAPPAEPADPSLTSALERSLQKMIERDGGLLNTIKIWMEKGDPILNISLVAAVGAARSREGAAFLCNYLGKSPMLDMQLLQHIGKAPGILPIALSDRDLDRVRKYLDSRDPGMRREAALAVGRLDDTASIPQLLELMDDSNGGVQENAYWSTKKITGLRFRMDRKRWRQWFDGEQKWWSEAGERQLANLTNGENANITSAMNELGGHWLYRNEITEKLAPLLSSPRAEISNIAFAAVVSLASSRAVAVLVQLLESENDRLRAKAAEALTVITGEYLGDDPLAWRLRYL